MSSQSIMDRVVAAKHSIAGQGLAKSVCKATTEEIIGPKKKHLDYLLQCTNEPNVSIPQMADLLIERTGHTSWVVVYKSLITIHNLMNYGNERFTQYLASNNCSFNLGSFVDKGGVQGYDMSTFIRRYAKYLNEKAVSYRNMAFDFCKVKRGKDDGLLRTMNTEKLLKALPVLQQQLDALLEFDCTPNELTNGVINACFMLLFKDLIRLFACYNDGIINLLEKYFDMNKKQCKEALDIYKKFLVRMDKVSEFLKVAESVGIDKGDIPDLAKGMGSGTGSAPASLLDALEQHLAALEGKKGTTPTSTSANKPSGFASALNTISNNSNTFSVSDEEKKKILDEENLRLQQLKEKRLKELGQDVQSPSGTAAPANNPFATGGTPSKQPSVDLFDAGSPTATVAQPPAASTAAASTKPSDDLLNLTGNPFIQNVQSVMASAYPPTQQPPPMAATNPFGAPAWQNGSATGTFTSDADFASAFNTNTSAAAGLDFTTNTTPSGGGSNLASPMPQVESPLDPYDPRSTSPLPTGGTRAGAPSAIDIPGAPSCSSPFDNPLGSLAGMPGSPMKMGTSPIMGSSPLVMPGSPMKMGTSPIMGANNPMVVAGSPMTFGSSPMTIGSNPMTMGGTGPMNIGGSSPLTVGGMNPMSMGGGSMGVVGSPGALGSSPTGLTGFSELALPSSPARLSRSASPTYLDTTSANLGRSSPALSDSGATGFDAFGEVLQPLSKQSTPAGGAKPSQEKLIKGDLDTSLVQLAGNLNINGPSSQVKKTDHQWKPKNDSKLTGGTNWQRPPGPVVASAAPAPSWQPTSTFPQQPMGGMQAGYQTNPMGMQMGMAPQPMMGVGGVRPMVMGPMPVGAQPMYGGMAAVPQPMGAFSQPRPAVQQPQQANVNDPFGAL